MNKKTVRPRLGYWELNMLHKLINKEYHDTKTKLNRGASNEPHPPIKEELYRIRRLRRHLGKLLKSLKET